jgi:hypothetical protein
MWHVTSHLRHLHNPDVQRRILAILWMVPIYSVTSWLALVFSSAQPFLGAFRDCYEAYVVYTFIALLIAILAKGKGMQEVIQIIATQQVQDDHPSSRVPTAEGEESKGGEGSPPEEEVGVGEVSSPKQGKHNVQAPCPCCIPSKQRNNARAIAASTLWQCQTMAIQFVLLKPLLAVAPFVIRLCGVRYDEHSPIRDGNIDWTAPRLYVLIVANISVSFAFYGLLSFYHIVAKKLAWCDPWPKFLCIKGVVFFSFWQDILLQIMSGWGLIDSHGASQIQNLLICIEMFMASIAHFYVFPHHEWKKGYEKSKSVSLTTTLALPDFVTDVRQIASRKGWGDEESLEGGRRRGSSIASYGSVGRTSPGHGLGQLPGQGHVFEGGSPGSGVRSTSSATIVRPDLHHYPAADGRGVGSEVMTGRGVGKGSGDNDISQLTTSTLSAASPSTSTSGTQQHGLHSFLSPVLPLSSRDRESYPPTDSDTHTPSHWFVSPTLSHQNTPPPSHTEAEAVAGALVGLATSRSEGRLSEGGSRAGVDMLSVASSPRSREASPFQSDLSDIGVAEDRAAALNGPFMSAAGAAVGGGGFPQQQRVSTSSSSSRRSPDMILHGSSEEDSEDEDDSSVVGV